MSSKALNIANVIEHVKEVNDLRNALLKYVLPKNDEERA
jgi:hypothetical protein